MSPDTVHPWSLLRIPDVRVDGDEGQGQRVGAGIGETLEGRLAVARWFVAALVLVVSSPAAAQEAPPSLRAAPLPAEIVIDGRLSEIAWESAEAIDDFRQT